MIDFEVFPFGFHLKRRVFYGSSFTIEIIWKSLGLAGNVLIQHDLFLPSKQRLLRIWGIWGVGWGYRPKLSENRGQGTVTACSFVRCSCLYCEPTEGNLLQSTCGGANCTLGLVIRETGMKSRFPTLRKKCAKDGGIKVAQP